MSDLIDRQEAIKALGERPWVWTDSDYEIAQRNQFDADKLAIETVPSVEPERKTGKWIPDDDGRVRCSECQKKYDWTSEAQFYKFCPNCGVKNE